MAGLKMYFKKTQAFLPCVAHAGLHWAHYVSQWREKEGGDGDGNLKNQLLLYICRKGGRFEKLHKTYSEKREKRVLI